MRKKVLVTGARGFTGCHFAKYAEAEGHQVVPLQANLLDAESLNSELKGQTFDFVVHCAAISFVGHGNSVDFYNVNVIGTENLLKALYLLEKMPGKVLIASSANVYGNCTAGVVSECSPPHPVNHYAISKLAMEQVVSTYFDQIPLVITRPFNYTGPEQNERFVIPKIVAHFGLREPVLELGNIDVIREYNDVRVICEAYMKLLESDCTSDIFNVCTSVGYSLSEVVCVLSEMTRHAVDIRVNQKFVRPNEITKLIGDNRKLRDKIGELSEYTLTDTLRSMLKVSRSLAE